MPVSRANIAKAVDSAFKAVGDIAESVTLRRTTYTHNTSTGINTSTTTDYTIEKAIFTNYQVSEIDRVYILTTDVKLIVRQNEITITPNHGTDTIIRNSKTYNIVRVIEDPSSSIYIFQLRAP